MNDMEVVEAHNGLYKTVNEVATNVALIKQHVEFLNEKLTKQNGRVDKAEINIEQLEKVNQELLSEVKKFNTNEISREKSRKSLRMWLIDNTSGVGITLLTAYLIYRFGF